MALTTRKLGTGQFAVDWNGVDTGYRIVNGSLGLSGRDTPNMYGIVRPNGKQSGSGRLRLARSCSPSLHLREAGGQPVTKAEFLLRTLIAHADADIYVLLDNGDWMPIEDLEVATTQAIVLHPVRPLVEAAP